MIPAVTLYTNKLCPFAQRCAIAFEVARVDLKKVEVNLYGASGFTKARLKSVEASHFSDPKGYVPVLEVGDELVRESISIVDRAADLDDRLKPKDEEAAATAIALCETLAREGRALVQNGGSRAKVRDCLATLDASLEASDYLAGPSLSTADAILFPFLWRIDQTYGDLTGDFKHLSAYLQRMTSLPSVKNTLTTSWWWWW